jgi:hypothetical protein
MARLLLLAEGDELKKERFVSEFIEAICSVVEEDDDIIITADLLLLTLPLLSCVTLSNAFDIVDVMEVKSTEDNLITIIIIFCF